MTRFGGGSIARIERRMEGVDQGSIRYQILSSVKNFKTSWIELGQALYSVWKDKLYKEWGYMTFDAYTAKEIGIRKMTAMKLLRSYYFLEKEDPSYIKKDYAAEEAASVPSYESVNVLRLARNKNSLDKSDYHRLKKDVLDFGKDAREVKKDLAALLRQREELEPEEARRKRRVAVIKRLLSSLKTLKTDLENSKLVPVSIIKETSELIKKIEGEIE